MKQLRGWAALTLIPALVAVAGCDSGDPGDPDPATTATGAAAFPVTIGSGETAVEILARPERIVSLSPTSTEMLFAIGAGEAVVAADEFSDFPPEAPTTDLSGFEPSAEAVLGHQPDLVVVQADAGGLVDSLAQVEVPTIVHPPAVTLDDTYTQLAQLGAATGQVAGAATLAEQVRTDLAAVEDTAPAASEPLTYYHELDPNFFTVTSSTFIGELYGLLGMRSIADEAEDTAGGYPQLTPEFILATDPDVILLADGQCCEVDAAAVAGRPGWDELTAVQQDRIITLDEDLASRWGPRVVEFLQTLATELAALEPAG